MTIRVQTIWNGHRLGFRALVCGGIRVYSDVWDRKTATAMLDALTAEGFDRRRIRFRHV